MEKMSSLFLVVHLRGGIGEIGLVGRRVIVHRGECKPPAPTAKAVYYDLHLPGPGLLTKATREDEKSYLQGSWGLSNGNLQGGKTLWLFMYASIVSISRSAMGSGDIKHRANVEVLHRPE